MTRGTTLPAYKICMECLNILIIIIIIIIIIFIIIWPLTPSSAEIKVWLELYFHSPVRLHGIGAQLKHSDFTVVVVIVVVIIIIIKFMNGSQVHFLL